MGQKGKQKMQHWRKWKGNGIHFHKQFSLCSLNDDIHLCCLKQRGVSCGIVLRNFSCRCNFSNHGGRKKYKKALVQKLTVLQWCHRVCVITKIRMRTYVQRIISLYNTSMSSSTYWADYNASICILESKNIVIFQNITYKLIRDADVNSLRPNDAYIHQ